jgi:hypothetical protein
MGSKVDASIQFLKAEAHRVTLEAMCAVRWAVVNEGSEARKKTGQAKAMNRNVIR